MKRIVWLLPLVLAACAAERQWRDVSGRPASSIALTVCQGRSTAVRGELVADIRNTFGGRDPLIEGCMAEYGYVLR